jgi:hypothetical protein
MQSHHSPGETKIKSVWNAIPAYIRAFFKWDCYCSSSYLVYKKNDNVKEDNKLRLLRYPAKGISGSPLSLLTLGTEFAHVCKVIDILPIQNRVETTIFSILLKTEKKYSFSALVAFV